MAAAADGPRAALVLAPFRGVRFDRGRVRAGAVTSPPYDVLGPVDVERLMAGEPHNVVRVVQARGGHPRPLAGYAQAGTTLRRWLSDGTLRQDPEPALYVYDQEGQGAHARGLLGALALPSQRDGVVLPHEDVMPGPVEDRLALLRATRANLEPILLVHDHAPTVSSVVSAAVTAAPLIDAVDGGGMRHRLWALTEPTALHAVAAELAPRRALLADGHHRYTAYRRYCQEQHAAGRGAGPWDHGLALLVDDTDAPLQVGAIHRVVAGLGLDTACGLASRVLEVRAHRGPPEAALQAIQHEQGPALVLADAERCATLRHPNAASVQEAMAGAPPSWRTLDVAVLHELLVRRVWQVGESALTYHHDLPGALRASAGGVAVLLRPVPTALVREVAGRGELLPRKSTSFGPKPRSGFVLRLLNAG